MKVTVFTTMPQGIYSGGRYLSLMLAYAMSRAGAEVTYITDNTPLFERDFAPFDRLCPIRTIVAPTFALPDDLTSDWVVVIPTGGFNNRFYNAALDHARARNARLALLSFETPNWFAAMSPWPRSAMPTESWRQVVAGGGLVVTIAQEGVDPARAYFGEGAGRAQRRFGFWHPSINDLAAEAAQQEARARHSVTMFVRTEDPHKGARDLLRLPPEVLEGQVLSLVFGRGVDEDFIAALRQHFAPARDFAIEVLAQITDLEKFVLLSRSRMLLFPSYFEGYGYPPVEAAWMGVPTVAWDLPLLREVAGDAVMAVPPGDIDSFAAAIRETLAKRPAGPGVRALMRVSPDTLTAGQRMLDLLRDAEPDLPMPLAPPPLLNVANGGIGLSPQAARLAEHHAGTVHLYEVAARLQDGRVTVTARIEGARKGDQLRVTLPVGGTMPPVALDGDKPRRILCEGQLDAWPAGEGSLELGLTLARSDRSTLNLGKVALAPDWAALLAPSPDGGTRQPHDCLVLADPAEMAARPLLAATLCEVCAGLQQAGLRVALILPRDAAPPPATLTVDLLPLFDAAVTADRAAMAQVAAQRRGGAGPVVLPRAFCATAGIAADEGLVLDPGGDAADEVVIVLGGEAPPRGRQALRPDALRWGRRGRAVAEAPLAVVVPPGPVADLAPAVRAGLKLLEKALPGLRLVTPAALCATDVAIVAGVNSRLVPLAPAELAAHLAGTGRIVGLRLGGDDIRDPGAALTEAMLAAYQVPVMSLEDGTSEIIAALTETGALAAEGLAGLLAGHLATTAAPRWPPLPLTRPAALARPAPPPPTLVLGDVLGLSATLDPESSALGAGWVDRTVLGARIAADSGTLVFRLGSPPADCTQLELLLHLSPAADPGLGVKIVLNGHLLGTLGRLPVGASVHRLPTRKADWADGDQVLLILLVRGEGSAASKITLIALSPTGTALPPPASRPAAQDVAMAPLYAASIAETSGVVSCRLNKGAAPGFLRLAAGWSVPEADYVWSAGPVAVLGFHPPLVSQVPLLLSLQASTLALPNGTGQIGQRMILRHGTQVLADTMIPTPSPAAIPLALPVLPAGASLDMVFLDFPDAVRPSERGMSSDARLLGMALHGAECRVLSHQMGGAPMRPDADPAWPVLSARIAAAPGLLCLRSKGAVPPGVRFGLIDTQATASPLADPAGGWSVTLPVTDEVLAGGRADIQCLAAGPLPSLQDLVCGIWTDPPHRRPGAPDDERMLDVSLTTVRDRAPEAPANLAPAVPVNPLSVAQSRLQLPAAFDFRAGSAHLDLLGRGWSSPEESWVWSASTDTMLFLPAQAGAVLLRLMAGALVTGGLARQRVVLTAGGQSFATILLTRPEPQAITFVLPPGSAPGDEMRLHLPDAASPQALGMSGDARQLALQLHQLQVEALPAPLLQSAAMLREAQNIALVHAAQMPRGDWAILVDGPQGTAPFGLAVPPRDGRATVIAHAHPAIGGWQVLLVVTAEDIAEGGLVSLEVYATEAEAGARAPSDHLRLSMPPRSKGKA